MKLLFVSQTPNSRLMGVPRVIYSIGDEMQKRGHAVDYFFEEHGPKPVIKQAAMMEWAVRIAPVVGFRSRKKSYDAIITTTASGWALSSFRPWLLPRKTKIISWHHGFEALMWQQMLAEEQAGSYQFSKRFKLYYNSILWANQRSISDQDAALFTSTEERDWVQQQHPQHAHKALYLPNGVSGDYYYMERFEQPFAQNPRLLFVGYWDPWRKGRKYLAAAYRELHQRYPDIRLTLAGTKLNAEEILPDFPPNTHASIEVIPNADEAALIALYKSHDIFVLPSLFEGMPLVVLEAMASALPVVTTNNNGMKDLIVHEENGLLVPRRDVSALVNALSQLIESPNLRRKLGISAYETVSRYYTWRQVSDIFEESLFRVLHNKLSPSS